MAFTLQRRHRKVGSLLEGALLTGSGFRGLAGSAGCRSGRGHR